MKRNIFKAIIQIAINTVAITLAYKLGERSGYSEGRNDGEMAGRCKHCVMYDEESDSCADIPDFDKIYS